MKNSLDIATPIHFRLFNYGAFNEKTNRLEECKMIHRKIDSPLTLSQRQNIVVHIKLHNHKLLNGLLINCLLKI